MSSTITHTGVGQATADGLGYSFSFATLHREDIQVEVIDPSNVRSTKTVTTDYTIENYLEAGSSNSHIKFVSSDARGFTDSQTTYKVRISRQTSSTPKVSFTAGSSITASDLNTQGKQAFHLSEENRDSINALALGDSSSAIQIDSSNIKNLTIQAIDIKEKAVETDKIDDLAVTTGKIADDAVTTDKLANSINETIAGKADTGANISTFTNDSQFITASQVPNPFVTGMILMFTGAAAPTGWVFCDNSTAAQAAGAPDLRDRFIVCAGGSYSAGTTGGLNSVTLAESEMPSHFHTFSGSNTHSHDYKGIRGDDHNADGYVAAVNQNDYAANVTIGASADDGVKNATITISGDTGSKGGSDGVTQAHENRPPFYALAYIMKT